MTSVVSGLRQEAPPVENVPKTGATIDEVAAAIADSGLVTKGGVELRAFEGKAVTVVNLPAVEAAVPASTTNGHVVVPEAGLGPELSPLPTPVATTPVDDRFVRKNIAMQSPAAVREEDRDGSWQSRGLMSTWRAGRIRYAASRLGNVVARNNMLRAAGLL